ncbi:response regulator transcription factor [Zhihengliuella sp.]|uniref:winged helix-turn-helix transcriptional regulator n=1 Tax=Zhihengliuella sp. TaxID=1954483 RepID=UPI0028112790|nr:response regulator transcription factor [Zhihengliuella sp.]
MKTNERTAANSSQPRVVVAQCERVAREVTLALGQANGLAMIPVESARAVVEQVNAAQPQLVVLDSRLPDSATPYLIRQLRALTPARVAVIASHGDVETRIASFEAGADQYIDTGLSPRELRARLRSLLRRDAFTQPAKRSSTVRSIYTCEELTVDPAGHRVTVGDAEVELTRTEFSILMALFAAQIQGGRVLGREALIHRLGAAEADRSAQRTLEVHMANLRRKLGEKASAPRWIRTVRGVGYQWLEPIEAVEIDGAQTVRGAKSASSASSARDDDEGQPPRLHLVGSAG